MNFPKILPWSDVLVLEYDSIPVGKVSNIPRFALFAPEAYEMRFNELLSRGYGWINMSAMGVLDHTLIVQIEYPNNSNNISRWQFSVNYSRSIDDDWDLSGRIKIIE